MGRFGWFLWCVLLDVLCIRANVLLHTVYRFGRIFDIQHRISNMLYDVAGKVQVWLFERNKYDGKHKYLIAVTRRLLIKLTCVIKCSSLYHILYVFRLPLCSFSFRLPAHGFLSTYYLQSSSSHLKG